MTLALNTERKIFSEKKRLSKAFFWSKDDFEKSTEKSCEMLFDDVHVDFFGDSSSDQAAEGSGNFMELPRTCVENQFVCFYRLGWFPKYSLISRYLENIKKSSLNRCDSHSKITRIKKYTKITAKFTPGAPKAKLVDSNGPPGANGD